MSKLKWTENEVHIDSSDAPCPFCGHTLLTPCVERRNPAQPQSGDEEDDNLYSVYCIDCHCASGSYGTLELAVESWQKRNDTVEQAVQKEKIKNLVRLCKLWIRREIDLIGKDERYAVDDILIRETCESIGNNDDDDFEVCRKCYKSEAWYNSNEYGIICTRCFAEWWVDGLEPESEEQRAELMAETLRDLEEKHRLEAEGEKHGEETGQEGDGSELQVGQVDPPEG